MDAVTAALWLGVGLTVAIVSVFVVKRINSVIIIAVSGALLFLIALLVGLVRM